MKVKDLYILNRGSCKSLNKPFAKFGQDQLCSVNEWQWRRSTLLKSGTGICADAPLPTTNSKQVHACAQALRSSALTRNDMHCRHLGHCLSSRGGRKKKTPLTRCRGKLIWNWAQALISKSLKEGSSAMSDKRKINFNYPQLFCTFKQIFLTT